MLAVNKIREFLNLLLKDDPTVQKVLLKEYWRLDKIVEPILLAQKLNKCDLLNNRINLKYPLTIVQYYYLHWTIKCHKQPDYRAAYYLSRVYLSLK